MASRCLKHGSNKNTSDSRLEFMLRIVSFLALLPLYVRWNILYGAAPSLVLFWDKVNCEDTVDHVWLVCNYMLTWKEKIGFLLKGNPQL